ncbi:alpha/beta fold hydrolase [uncultured Chloroflexus sp.]|uniref:alpha/beta hydrolase n=1 Tax=uncultured Chloroflexus sp. TaxID=214040 RepID=UPI002624AE69|nr:alpha/beta fold hydrolase [uncultured Chloroflexus sp.]
MWWLFTLLIVAGCTATARPEARPTPHLDPISAERREVRFSADDGITLAGELTLPHQPALPPLVVIIHHSGPVDRDAYGYLAELLVARGYAVFRFDKRGTGASGGAYGCCEAADALAAYRAAVAQPGINQRRVFLVAQSIGTRYVAASFAEYVAATSPCGVALLSNLLGPDEITAIAAPIHVIVADSEPDLQHIGPDAVVAHNARWPYGASLYIAEGAEHTLFDIRDGPIDWSNPNWVQRYHRGAMASLLEWLDQTQCRF